LGLRSPKVFGIGFQKTGTSTLHAALTQLGYASQKGVFINHPKGIHVPPPVTTEKILPYMIDLAQRHDAFSDNPWPLLFRELDVAYPGSKFVLTVRDPAKWIESVVRHFGARADDVSQWIYGVPYPAGNEPRYLEVYQSHNNAVRSYFAARPRDLLEIDIEAEARWEPLCEFLDMPRPNRRFPHENRATERERKNSSLWRRLKQRVRSGTLLRTGGR
jgi:hypothetical protein